MFDGRRAHIYASVYLTWGLPITTFVSRRMLSRAGGIPSQQVLYDSVSIPFFEVINGENVPAWPIWPAPKGLTPPSEHSNCFGGIWFLRLSSECSLKFGWVFYGRWLNAFEKPQRISWWAKGGQNSGWAKTTQFRGCCTLHRSLAPSWEHHI